MAGSLMHRETSEAPDVVDRMIRANDGLVRELGERLRRHRPRFVVTCARGSSDSAATFAKYLIEIALGVVVASVGPSVRSVYGARLGMTDALFLAISQSGRSPDLIALAEMARTDGALTVAFVNDQQSPLAAQCEVVLPLHAGTEKSVAATKSYIASLAAILQLVGHWSSDAGIAGSVARLAEDLRDALENNWSGHVPAFLGVADLFVAGRGAGFAAAQEAALKLKEVCGIHAEAVSAAELMHGPMTLAGPDFPVVLFSQSDEAFSGLVDLAQDLVARGVPVFAAGPAAPAGVVALRSSVLHPFAQPIAAIQSFYPFAEALAAALGRDPDRPPHLSKVTETI